jgi:hypothetical protein
MFEVLFKINLDIVIEYLNRIPLVHGVGGWGRYTSPSPR